MTHLYPRNQPDHSSYWPSDLPQEPLLSSSSWLYFANRRKTKYINESSSQYVCMYVTIHDVCYYIAAKVKTQCWKNADTVGVSIKSSRTTKNIRFFLLNFTLPFVSKFCFKSEHSLSLCLSFLGIIF